jgi:uncharacterized DUF497 family protein
VDFEWDDVKAAANRTDHGVTFTEAQEAFTDPHRIILPDPAHSQLEARYFCLGLVRGSVLTVRFTLREARVRLIGAGYWRAYRKLYHEKQTR